jgi:hypothetical protein
MAAVNLALLSLDGSALEGTPNSLILALRHVGTVKILELKHAMTGTHRITMGAQVSAK